MEDDEGSASPSASDAYGYQHVRPDDSAYGSSAVGVQEAGSGKTEEKVGELPAAAGGGGVVREQNNEKVVELPGTGGGYEMPAVGNGNGDRDRQIYEMGTGEDLRR